jgi:hypothetical protein
MSHPASASRYFVPEPSHWPVVGSFALLLLATGAILTFNSIAYGGYFLLGGFAVLTVMLFGWFGRVIGESEGQRYNLQVPLGHVVLLRVSLNFGYLNWILALSRQKPLALLRCRALEHFCFVGHLYFRGLLFEEDHQSCCVVRRVWSLRPCLLN